MYVLPASTTAQKKSQTQANIWAWGILFSTVTNSIKQGTALKVALA